MPLENEQPIPSKELGLESISASIVEKAPEDADECTTLEQLEILAGC